jgi:hypothetical protein
VSIPFAHSFGSGAWRKYSAIGINADQCDVPVESKDGRSDKDGFRGLWRRLKPADKPDEVNYFLSSLLSLLTILLQGVPFDIDDAMFNPPMPRPTSEYSLEPQYPNQPYQFQQNPSPVLDHQEPPVVSHR